MKLLAVALLFMVSEAIPEEPIVITPTEHRVLVKKYMDMQEQIETLEKKLRTAKEASGCA